MQYKEAFDVYLDKVIQSIREGAASKSQPIPSLRKEARDDGGQLIGADYFKYLVYGRPPGKRPPPQAMLDYIKRRPDILQSMRYTFQKITERGAAYIIGRALGEKGSRIWRGEKPGVDLLGAMDAHMEELLKTIARNEALTFVTSLRNELNR